MTCQTCGHKMSGNFCQNCGEKRFDKHELSLKHFAEESLESFTHFDNKFLRSFKTLMLKPGKLGLEFVEGRKVRLMKPLQLFLVVNLIFFFILPSNPFALKLYNYVTYRPFTDYNTTEIVKQKLEKENMTMQEYGKYFNEKVQTDSKKLVFVYALFYGLVFALLFVLYRRSLAEHFIFALHFVSFFLILSILQHYLISWPFYKLFYNGDGYAQGFDNFSSILMELIIAVYLYFGINEFYKGSKIWSFSCAILIGASFFFLMQVYRMMLFFEIVRH